MNIYQTQKEYDFFNQRMSEIFQITYVQSISPEPIFVEKSTTRGELHPAYGLKHSDETKKILSQLKQGFVFTDEHRRNMRESARKNKNFAGKKHSEETKKLMANSAKNRTDRKKLRCSCVICHQEVSNNHIGIHYKKHQ